MGRLIKWLLYLFILAFIALVAYAYLGEFFNVSFAPDTTEVTVPVILDGS